MQTSIKTKKSRKKLILPAVLAFILMAGGFFLFSGNGVEQPLPPSKAAMAAQMLKLPLVFERNDGQTDASVKFLTRGRGHAFFFTPREIVMVFHGAQGDQKTVSSILKMQFVGANPHATLEGREEASSKSNYFVGNDPQQWRTNIPHYKKVAYQDLYSGIDALFYGNGTHFEYDICIAPGASPQQARFRIEGAQNLSTDSEGNLHILAFDGHELFMQKPYIYQLGEQGKTSIDGEFVLLAQNEVGFAVGSYDTDKLLVIDPVLAYSTYLGGSNEDVGSDIAVDTNGCAYVTGVTTSLDFPTTPGAFQPSFEGGATDVFVTKLNPTGTSLVYSTYLGGIGQDDSVFEQFSSAIALDKSENAYITGSTQSANFPTTPGAFQTTLNGFQNAFVTKLSRTGSELVYSTYLGGTSIEEALDIKVDDTGSAYVVGDSESLDFPTTPNAFQPTVIGVFNAFITKLNPQGTALVYSTLLGKDEETAYGIAIDPEGHAYVTGFTTSPFFPTTPNAFQRFYGGGTSDAFVTKLNADGSNLVYSTFLGGSNFDTGLGIALDPQGQAYVTGITFSSNFPTTTGAYQPSFQEISDVFVSKINFSGSQLVYSTFLGVSGEQQGNGIAVDRFGNAFVTGLTDSASFPTTSGAFQGTYGGGELDAFLTKINEAGSGLIYSSFIGGNARDNSIGITLDATGNAFIVGNTRSANFPTTEGAFQRELKGIRNAFVAKFNIGTPIVTSISPVSGPTIGGTEVTIRGDNLGEATRVEFGPLSAQFKIINNQEIVAISPPHAVGVVDVTVTSLGGTSPITAADQFTYVLTATTTTLTVAPNPANAGDLVTLTATVAPATATGSVEFFDGATSLGKVTLSNGIATLTISRLAIGTHILKAVYSGDANFAGSTSLAVFLNIDSNIFPPIDVSGVQRVNRFAAQADYVNIIRWRAPTQGRKPVAYQIYDNANLTKLLAVVSDNQKLQYKEHNRRKGETSTYYIIAVDQFGNRSTSVTVTIP